MFGIKRSSQTGNGLPLVAAISIVAVLLTTFAWQDGASSQSAGDPLTVSLRVYDTSGTSIAYSGEICFRIETGGSSGPLESCVYSTTAGWLEWSGLPYPPSGFGWGASTTATIVSNTTECLADIGFEDGPTVDSTTGIWEVRFAIRTTCPSDPPPPTGVGERMTITIVTTDDSGAEFDLPGEICVRLNPGTSGAWDTCVYRMAVTAIEISGFRVPASGHDWDTSATITSDTTGCSGRVSYLSGPTLIDGDYNVRYLVSTSCSSIPVDPDIPTSIETPIPASMATVVPSTDATAEPTETAQPTTEPGEEVINAFTLLTTQRACEDQRFTATWDGSGLERVEFALSNTSDNWTSGWLIADENAGSFSASVDHHAYDKVMARATFTDGTTTQTDADVGTCTPAPGGDQVDSSGDSGTGKSPVVRSLPNTGVGLGEGIVWVSAILLTAGGILAILALWVRLILRR